MSGNSNISDENTPRPTRHVVYKCTFGPTSNPASEPERRPKARGRKKRTSMDTQLLEEAVARPSTRRSGRNSVVLDEDEPTSRVTTPVPVKQPVGRPKGRVARRRNPPSVPSTPRKSRRTAFKSGPTNTEEEEQDYELLEHSTERANMDSQKTQLQSPTSRRAFESIHKLYEISLEDEEVWRTAADSVADCLDDLREQWHVLESKLQNVSRIAE